MMITKNQLLQIAGWVRPGLQLEDLPNNSWNANDPDTWAKVYCAVTGCETRSNALALINTETPDGAMTLAPAMWQLEVTVKDRREVRRQIPLCYEHSRVIARALAKSAGLSRGTSFCSARDIVRARMARKETLRVNPDEVPHLISPPPIKFGLRVQNLVTGLTELLNLVRLSEELEEDERLYHEAYARYDELCKQ